MSYNFDMGLANLIYKIGKKEETLLKKLVKVWLSLLSPLPTKLNGNKKN